MVEATIIARKRIAWSLALTALAAAPNPGAAQQSPNGAFAGETIPIDDIIVTGEGLEAPPGELAYGSVTIVRDRLANEASGRLENALADVAGFQQFRRSDSRSSNPSAQGATLRGLGGNASSRALVLLDGVPQADPFFGYIPFSALVPERLARARITRGGGAGAFGAGALAGTVELFSGGSDDLSPFDGRVLYGSRSSMELSAGLSGTLGNGFASLGGRWDRGDGFFTSPKRQRTALDVPAAYEGWSASGRVVIRVSDDTEIQARGLVFDDNRILRFANADNRSQGADASLRLIAHGPWAIEALAYLQARNFASRTVSAATGRIVLDQYNTPSTGIGGKFEIRPPVGMGHVLRIGADVRRSSGRLYENNFNAASGVQTQTRTAGGHNITLGLFVEDDWTIGDVTLTGGARIDHWAIAGGFLEERALPSQVITQGLTFPARSGWRATGRAGILFKPTSTIDLRAAVYSGFRVPTLNELYRPFRVFPDATAANGALGLEKLRGADVGIDVRPGKSVHLGLTIFWNELDDAVANVTVARGPGTFPQVGFVPETGVFRQRQNIDAIRVWGIEGAAALEVGDFRLSGTFAFNDPKVRASGIAAALDGKRPAQSAKFASSLTAAWAPASGASISATLRYIGAQYEDDIETVRLPDAMTADIVIGVPLTGGVRLVGRAENIFDEEVVTRLAGGNIDRGTPRTLWLGFHFTG